jgi:plastocyanin
MKTLIGSRSRILTGYAFLFSILSISNSCTKSSMDNMYGIGGNTGSKGSPGTNEVWIQGMAFTPSSITVKEGTTITWTNKDAISHTVTSDDNLFDSGSLGNGKTFTYTFTTTGTYQYHCSIHPSMTAKVIVTSASTASAVISINNMAFAPATITVSAGTIITWTNNDSVAHTVTSDNGLFDSGAISAPGLYSNGGTFSYTFATTGTYPYHCTYHSGMTGKVIVN